MVEPPDCYYCVVAGRHDTMEHIGHGRFECTWCGRRYLEPRAFVLPVAPEPVRCACGGDVVMPFEAGKPDYCGQCGKIV